MSTNPIDGAPVPGLDPEALQANGCEISHDLDTTHGGLNRRGLLRATAGAAAAVAYTGRPDGIGIAPAFADSPFPAAKARELRRVDDRWLWRKACGSDQWPHVPINGSTILAGYGDGYGFNTRGTKAYLGFSRISGSATDPRGDDAWDDTRGAAIRRLRAKPCSFVRFGDTIYAYVTGDIDNRDATRLLRSPLQGGDFRDVGKIVMRRSVHGLQVVGAVHHRFFKGNAPVLLVAGRGNLKDIYAGKYNTTVWAARVGSGSFDNVDEWEWYTGSRNGGSAWSRGRVRNQRFDLASGRRVQPLLNDPAGCGKHVMISWCPSLDGYVMSKTHDKTNLALFYGPTWHGPWSTLFYGPFVPGNARGQATIFTAQVVSMWSEGGTVAVLWSGYSGGAGSCQDKSSSNYDAVHLTRFAVR